jgi:hypothetical protein
MIVFDSDKMKVKIAIYSQLLINIILLSIINRRIPENVL